MSTKIETVITAVDELKSLVPTVASKENLDDATEEILEAIVGITPVAPEPEQIPVAVADGFCTVYTFDLLKQKIKSLPNTGRKTTVIFGLQDGQSLTLADTPNVQSSLSYCSAEAVTGGKRYFRNSTLPNTNYIAFAILDSFDISTVMQVEGEIQAVVP